MADAPAPPSDGVFLTCRRDGTVRNWSDGLAAAVGRDDLDGTPLAALLPDADASLDRALEDGTVSFGAPLGGVHYDFDATRLAGDADAAVALHGTPTGNADRPALDRVTDAFFTLDDDWTLTYVNDHAQTVLSMVLEEERSRDELVGTELLAALPEGIDDAFVAAHDEAMDSLEPVALEEYYPPMDAWFDVRAYPSPSGITVYVREITEQHRRMATLETRERVLQSLYEVTSDTDRSFDEKVATLLEVGCDVLGVDYGTVAQIRDGEYVFEHVRAPPDSGIAAGDVVPVESTTCERVATREETLVLSNLAEQAPDIAARSAGDAVSSECYLGAPIFVEGDVYGTFCFYDETVRDQDFDEWEVSLVDLLAQWVGYELTGRQIRERLQRQNDRLEEFASIVSHDIRNPLSVLDGYLELAEETGDPDHFEQCRRTVDRMESLADELLALARAGEGVSTFEPVSIRDLVTDCWATAAPDDATLVVDTDATVRADRSRLRQLFENLVGNAVEHGDESVMVTVGDLDDGAGFFVADDGPGIPEDERETVFDAGHTTSDDGTGFGLYIVRRVAEAHGWTVDIAESESGGARFEFRGDRHHPPHRVGAHLVGGPVARRVYGGRGVRADGHRCRPRRHSPRVVAPRAGVPRALPKDNG